MKNIFFCILMDFTGFEIEVEFSEFSITQEQKNQALVNWIFDS